MYQYAINFIQSIYGFPSLTDSKLILCSHIQNDIVMHMKSEVSIPDIFTYISLHYFNPYTLSAIQLAITQVCFFSILFSIHFNFSLAKLFIFIHSSVLFSLLADLVPGPVPLYVQPSQISKLVLMRMLEKNHGKLCPDATPVVQMNNCGVRV